MNFKNKCVMMAGDYVIYKGKVVKITSDNYCDVIDQNDKEHKGVDLRESNIGINEAVLLACGFIQNPDNKNEFKCFIDDTDLNITGTVSYTQWPCPTCSINFSIRSEMHDTNKQIIVLSELQDFVRVNTNQELNIDFARLAEVAKI